MQDRFKFRAWDNKNKIYHHDDFVVTATGYIAKISESGEICQTDMEYDENLILEQCTGFNDKHGVLIYDGDIIQNDIGNRTVYFNGYCGCWGFKTNKFNSTFIDYSSVDFEIIGNIHENPELLAGVE